MAEAEGIEPPEPEGSAAFKAVERTNAQCFQMAERGELESQTLRSLPVSNG